MQKHKIIIAGPRDYTDRPFFEKELSKYLVGISHSWLEIIEGGALGVDRMARRFAIENGITFKTFDADWSNYGRAAGPIRNKAMAEYGNRLIAFWDGKSKGTNDMIKAARKACIAVGIVWLPVK